MRAPARRHVPDELARHHEPAGPDGPRRKQLAPVAGVRDEQLAVARHQVRVAARQDPGRRRRAGAEAASRNAGSSDGEDPRLAERRPDRPELGTERLEHRSAGAWRDPCPAGERRRRRRAGDVEPAARELEAGLERIHVGRRHGPYRGLPRAVPADEDAAGRAGIAQAGRVLAHRVPGRRVRPDLAVEQRPRPDPRARRPGDARARRRGASPARTPARLAGRRRTRLNRGPHSWASEGCSQSSGRMPSTRAWRASRAARGTESCRPAQATRRSDAAVRGSRASSAPTRRR